MGDAVRRLALVLVSTLLLIACGPAGGGGPSPAGTPRVGGALRVAMESESRTMDPVRSGQRIERVVYYNMYESLVGIDEKLVIKPLLATKWETPDPKTLVFTLRQGVKFHDGTEFNADAVKFNIDRVLTAASSPRKSELASVASVEVRDPSTVVFHLKNPDAALLSQLVDRAGMILSPDAIKKGGADFERKPLGAGTGPFSFVEWKRDDHLTLKRNPNYWKPGLPYLEEIVFRPITNTDTALSALRTGDVDVARQISFKDVASVRGEPDLIYRDASGLAFDSVLLNRGKGIFTDTAKAKAVALAIDRPQIQKTVFSNVGVVSYGPIPPPSWAFDPTEKIYDKGDPDKARAMATGFSFALLVDTRPDNIQAVTLIKDQLARAGITANIRIQEFGQLLNETNAHNFEAAFVGWSGRIDPDGNMFGQFHTGGGFNDGLYSNARVDKLLEDARVEQEQAKRKELYQEAQRVLVEDVARAFIRHGVAAQISTKRVHNFVLIADEIPRFAEVWKD